MPILQIVIGIVVAIVVVATLLLSVSASIGTTELALLGLVTIVLAAAGITAATRML